MDGDYYHPLTGNFLTRRSAGTNEYSAGVNPTINWGRVVGGTLAGIAGGILTAGNPLGVAAGVALFEGLYSAAEGKPASVVVRDAVVSGALAYVGGRVAQPLVGRLLSREAQGTVKYWNPLNIPEDMHKIASSFRGGSFAEITLTKPMTVYRVYGGTAQQLGRWYTATRPEGRLQAIIDYAIRPEWGNAANRLVGVRLPAGTRVYIGTTAPQGTLVGGGTQIYIPAPTRVDPSWVVTDVPFP